MSLLHFEYEVALRFSEPVREHAFLLRCLPPSFPGQEILDVQLSLDPCVPFSVQRDGFGNLLQLGRIGEAHGSFRYAVRGTAAVCTAERLPARPLPVFRYPSPFTEADDAMKRFLCALSLPEDPEEKALALARAVHGHMHYLPGVTGISTRASEAFSARRGVCQDFAHIYLSLARAASLPARYVNGLVLGEGASHAWCEVLLGGVWTGVDPTRGCLCGDDYIRFNIGRDYRDCPMERGIFTGTAQQAQQVSMRVSAQNAQ